MHTHPPSTRLYFLDWLRILAFLVLIVYHVGMYYVSWGWHINSPHASAALIPWMLMSSPWRLSLLFLLSGAATSLMLRKGQSGFIQTRSKRLLVPLLFGMFVIVPPQAWLEVVQKYGYAGGYLDFMARYLAADGSFCSADGTCLILPTWNHLWFVAYLWSYTAVLWLLLRWRPGVLGTLGNVVARALSGWRLLVLPWAVLLVLRLFLASRFGSTHALIDDWHNHAQYFCIFLLGAALARAQGMWEAIEEQRRTAFVLAAASWALLVFAVSPSVDHEATAMLRSAARCAMQWCAVLCVLGFGRRMLNFDHPLRARLGEAVFPVYILHQTIIILLADRLAAYALDARVEAPLLIGATLAFSYAGYEVVRRVKWTRPLFGLGATRGAGKAMEAGYRSSTTGAG